MADGFPRKFGKYHLLAPLAQGGMGALYLAVAGDRGLEKLCVIKTVLPHLADAEYVARFRDEAKVVVKLSHGNLVPVFDAGQVEGEIFLAMDFVEGKDLRAVWNRCAKKAVAFPVDVAVYVAKELCRGLSYAHGFGDLRLVHRDVSPPNVLVSFSGEVKLTDFGLASSTLKLEKTAPGIIYGKVSYMSPEQARGEPLDGRTDLYAAGIILWELLTGRQLFPPGGPEAAPGAQATDLLARAKDPRPDPPSKRAPRVPARLDEIVLRALTADPAERYQNGEEMRSALAGWLAKEAPATDGVRLEKFVTSLFAEDIAKERDEREALVVKTRKRIATAPPTDVERLVFAPPDPSTGAGATGRVDPAHAPRRRASDPKENDTRKGVAVIVPAAGPNGSTVMPRRPESDSGSAALAARPQWEEEESPNDIIGQVIDGRYEVRQLIGEGGMGRVYESEHVEIGKRVALKVLHPVYSRTPEVVTRFRQEARAASKIGHPNIVDVTDSGTTADGSVYFVMEYLEGVELAAVIDREGALDIHRALNIGTQICRALAAAHNAGIIHRDLKPENVFLIVREGTTDFVKVLDFGIAKSTELEEQRKERLTHPGMAMGTPEYMAPEQAAGRPADARSDVYAVGAILYEMVTGSPPYDGENFMEILTKKATLEPRPPREMRTDLPEVIERVILRALARDPAERPRSMEAFEYELTKCLAGRGVAVAKILGMPMPIGNDPSMGVSMPAAMGGGLPGMPDVHSQPPEIRPYPSAPGPQPVPVAAPGAPAAALGGMHSLEDDFSSDGGTQIVGAKSGGGGGWLLFFLLLLGGGGAAAWWFYLRTPPAGGEPVTASEASSLVAEGKHDAGEPDKARKPDKLDKKPDKGDRPDKGDKTEKPDPRPEPKNDQKVEPKPDRDPKPKQPELVDKPSEKVTPGAPPRDKREARSLLKQAKAAEAKMAWGEAKALYDRVARGRYEKASGLLGLANVAWQTKDFDTAITFGKQALAAGAGDGARMLLGHAYLKKGRYDEAIAMYRDVLKKNPRNREAQGALREAEKLKKKG